jgi:hypothetical protein
LPSDVAHSTIFITSILPFHLVAPPSPTLTTLSLGHQATGDHLSCRLAPPPCSSPAFVSHSYSFRWLRWTCFYVALVLVGFGRLVVWLYWATWIELIFEYVMEDLSVSMYSHYIGCKVSIHARMVYNACWKEFLER